MQTVSKSFVAVGVVSAVVSSAVGSDGADARRSYVAGKYELVVDQAAAGFVSSFAGGGPTADVVSEKLGTDHIVHKHLAGVKYEDIGLTCGTGMSKTFYAWIKDTLDRKFPRKNGAVELMTYDYKEAARVAYFNALVTEVGFPALDAASKEAAQLSVSLSPERTTRSAGSGTPVVNHESVATQKKWLAANFKLEISGVDATRVTKVDAFVVKQKMADAAVGDARDYLRQPTNLEIPNLFVTLPEAFAADWYKWQDDFVVKGNSGDNQERPGAISYLSPDLRTTLFKLTLRHVGIVKIDAETADPASESIRRVKVELYVEDVGFDFDNAAAF